MELWVIQILLSHIIQSSAFNRNIVMGFIQELLLYSSYFLLLSTVLQSQDAFVFFQVSEFGQDDDQDMPSIGRKLFIYAIFAMLCYLTLLVTPYINLPLRKLSLGGTVIILVKYICELLVYTKHMVGLLELGAIICDVIGSSIFYLVSARVVQDICERYGATDQTGKMFGVFSAIYALSILLGYAISYGCFRMLPVWTYLIILTSMVVLSGMICFFAFPMDRGARATQQLHEQQTDTTRQTDEAPPSPQSPAQRDGGRIRQDLMPLGQIIQLTFIMYKKMLLVLSVQMTLGVYISYSLNLLQYLIWTTQEYDSNTEKLTHNLDVILIFCGGAIVMSIIVGMLSESSSMKKVGFGSVIFTICILVTLYLAIAFHSLYATYTLYVFVGASLFGLVTWLLCACSKIFGGKFQAFSVTAQFVGVAMFFYDMLFILFESKVDVKLRLCLQLGVLIVSGVVCCFFLRKLPSGQLEILFEEQNYDNNEAARREQQKVEVEMMEQANTQKIEAELQKEGEGAMGPDLLL